MEGDRQSSARFEKYSADQPFDDIRNLYVGQIVHAKATVGTDRGALAASLSGELQLYGHVEGETFIVERLRRIALFGALVEPQADDRIGVLSLVGPLTESSIKAGPSGTTEDLRLKLHYAALSRNRSPADPDTDVVFPIVEQIAGSLSWSPVQPTAAPTIHLLVHLTANRLLDKQLGVIQSVELELLIVRLWAPASRPFKVPTHNSLRSNCQPPTPGPCAAGMTTITRNLPLKFINYSRVRTFRDQANPATPSVEGICERLIDGVCEVWRNKAALELNIQPLIEEGTLIQKQVFGTITLLDEQDINNPTPSAELAPSHASTSQLEVYVIDKFDQPHGGGITYDAGVASAYCILEVNPASQNRLLLAHELGHVFVLDHPGSAPDRDSSAGSIMQPADPNPPTNTLFNCRIFTGGPGIAPLNPLVTAIIPPPTDCFQVD